MPELACASGQAPLPPTGRPAAPLIDGDSPTRSWPHQTIGIVNRVGLDDVRLVRQLVTQPRRLSSLHVGWRTVRGFDESPVRKVLGENMLRVMQEAERVAGQVVEPR